MELDALHNVRLELEKMGTSQDEQVELLKRQADTNLAMAEARVQRLIKESENGHRDSHG